MPVHNGVLGANIVSLKLDVPDSYAQDIGFQISLYLNL